LDNGLSRASDGMYSKDVTVSIIDWYTSFFFLVWSITSFRNVSQRKVIHHFIHDSVM